jgi:hypothetical protein
MGDEGIRNEKRLKIHSIYMIHSLPVDLSIDI